MEFFARTAMHNPSLLRQVNTYQHCLHCNATRTVSLLLILSTYLTHIIST